MSFHEFERIAGEACLPDPTGVGAGESVDLGGGRIVKKKTYASLVQGAAASAPATSAEKISPTLPGDTA